MADPPAVRLGVAGWPVAHSRSPVMQNAALRAVGLAGWRYGRLSIPPDRFTETVTALPALGFRGINVTIPHKEAALALADRATARARAIGAANTLVFDADGSIRADNTDGPGLTAALAERGVPLAGASALVLGAGGTARAAVWALLAAGVGDVRVLGRTRARAQRLCEEVGGQPVTDVEAANLLVHCTPVGLAAGTDLSESQGSPIPLVALSQFDTVIDFVYREDGTPLIRAARDRGATTIDGLELLVRQGALSFSAFTGQAAPLTEMFAAVEPPH